LEKRMMALSPFEQNIWTLDYAINQRGIQVDIPAIEAAIKVVALEQARLNAEMKKVTGGAIDTCTQAKALGEWIIEQGVDIPGVTKADVLDALSTHGLPVNVRKALTLRQEAAKSSTAKLKKMLELVSEDGRIRNTLQYHGAGTGRWAGRGIQIQNYPRPKLEQQQIDDVLRILVNVKDVTKARDYIDMFHGSALDVLSSCLRGFITSAPGHDLIAADFANIEGRVLAWLAGEEWKLQAFRDYDAGTGPDLYLRAYAQSFNVTIDEAKPHRQTGKTMELAFGYQGGVGAWRTMEKVYRPPAMDDEKVNQTKDRWRAAHPAVHRYWWAIEEAAGKAVRNSGQKYTAGAEGRQVTFMVKGSFLWCRLPSGRVLCYPYARIDTKVTVQNRNTKLLKTYSARALASADLPAEWVVTRRDENCIFYMSVDGVTRKWAETDTYGGKLVENITQAVARDLLAHGLIENAHMNPVMHVHDEIVFEVSEDWQPEDGLRIIESDITALPAWAKDLPVAAEGWRGKRYRK
jgi:DNA polymerase